MENTTKVIHYCSQPARDIFMAIEKQAQIWNNFEYGFSIHYIYTKSKQILWYGQKCLFLLTTAHGLVVNAQSFHSHSQNIGLIHRDPVQSYPMYLKRTKEHLLLVVDNIAMKYQGWCHGGYKELAVEYVLSPASLLFFPLSFSYLFLCTSSRSGNNEFKLKKQVKWHVS